MSNPIDATAAIYAWLLRNCPDGPIEHRTLAPLLHRGLAIASLAHAGGWIAGRWQVSCFAVRLVRRTVVARRRSSAMCCESAASRRPSAAPRALPGWPARRAGACWAGGDKVDAALNPARQGPRSSITGRVDVYHPRERPPRERHGPNVRLRERALVCRRTDPNDKRLGGDSAAHGTVHHEGQAAEHLPLDDISPPREHGPNPGRRALVVAHRFDCICSGCCGAGGISGNVASSGSSRAHEGAREA